jgi:hypothetical protein
VHRQHDSPLAQDDDRFSGTWRRFGHERYSALGIAAEDWVARQRAASANWDSFGAPAASSLSALALDEAAGSNLLAGVRVNPDCERI